MTLASLEIIEDVFPHPNADKLEFVKVLGYKAIVAKDAYKKGEQVVFVQPDTVLPDSPWAEPYKKYAPKRVKAVKIRGEYSMGIVMKSDVLIQFNTDGKFNGSTMYIGKEVSDVMGIKKYVSLESPGSSKNNQIRGRPLQYGMFPTDEERYQNLKELPFGQPVDVTLKIDGQSCTFYCKKDGNEFKTGITSRTVDIEFGSKTKRFLLFYLLLSKITMFLKKQINNILSFCVKKISSKFLKIKPFNLNPRFYNKFAYIDNKYEILNKIKKYCIKNNASLALRGELYGNMIQNHAMNPDCKLSDIYWACYSVLDLDTLTYFQKGSELYFVNLCKKLDLPTVKVLETDVIFNKELIKHYDEVLENIDGKPFEGVVIKHSKGTFKISNKHYDMNK